MRRSASRYGLVGVAVTAWITAAATTLVPAAAGPAALAGWAFTLGLTAVIALVVLTRAMRRAILVVLLAAAGCASVASHVALAQPARTAVSDDVVAGGRSLELTATVTGKIERRATGELEFDAVAEELRLGSDPVRTLALDIIVRVPPAEVRGSALDVGARVRISGTASPSIAGHRGVLRVRASRGVDVLAPPGDALAVTSSLRRGLVAAASDLPGPGAELIPGLAVGDTSLVGADLDAAMKASALSHLTAVSGANCALVVGLAFGTAAALGARRGVRVVCALAALGGFTLLVTPEPSVARAAAMAAAAMLGVLLGRPAAGMNVLCLAVSALLIGDPWLSTSLGFALSAVATASLLICARPLARGLARWMPQPLALAAAVPLAAQLACGPLLILIAPSVPLYGVAANLLAAPAAPVATVVGLAACLAAPLPWLASGLAAVAWVPASWIAATAQLASDLPASGLPWLDGLGGLIALAVLGGAVGVLVALAPSRRRPVRIARGVAGAIVSVVAGVAIGTGLLTGVAGRWTIPAQWSVLACDVGQGDAVLVRSAGVVALIDTGPDPLLLDACLARTGVTRVDLLVLTHFDLDHVGGVDAVRGRTGTLLFGPTAAPGDVRIIDALVAAGARAVPARAGLHGRLGAASWRLLWPPEQSRAFPSGNDASIVLEVTGGGVPDSLFLGDLSASPQRALAHSGLLAAPYDVVKVAHHGSADQAASLYRGLHAAIALVTVGADNDYGHPRDETLALLAATGARVARTDESGVIAVWLEDGVATLWRDRGVAPRG